jgi:DNA-binding transcriptional LysR family regulator
MPWDDRISRRLKLRDLQTLLAVIDAGGIGKAADRLNYTQPAVSKAIAGLERTLGKRLFERGHKGIELTPYGEAMLKCGIAVFDNLRAGVEQIDFLSDPTAGQVRIACTELASAGIVFEVINRLVPRYPRIEFTVMTLNDSEAVLRDLEYRRVDLAIAQPRQMPIAQHMQKEVIYQEPLVAIAATQHPCARKRGLTLADLADEPWAAPPPGTFIRGFLTDVFRASGLPGPRIAVTAAPYMRMMLTASGGLLTMIPAVMLRLGARHLSIKSLPIELPASRRSVAIFTLKNRALSPVVQLFIDHARSLARSVAKD